MDYMVEWSIWLAEAEFTRRNLLEGIWFDVTPSSRVYPPTFWIVSPGCRGYAEGINIPGMAGFRMYGEQ